MIGGSALAVFGTGPALAIPSPELVIGSLSSISQLVALVTASLGGAAVLGTAYGTRRSAGRKASRALLWVAAGSLALLMLSAGFNVYQYFEHKNEKLERLQATLIRPSRDSGTPVLDPNLKELNYTQQTKHARGISTADTQKLIDDMLAGKRDDVVLLDVRETAETTMGSLPNATIVRWPDLAKAKLDFRGKIPIIFCHNGNRSHETCDALAAQGIDCRFIVGGLEKWVVESRKMTGLESRTLDTLRAIPRYRNDDVLLDTPQVKKLVDNEKAIFVDVRYPGEFKARHIPNAINLTIRTTPTEELKQKVAELPRRPIILPCYDRRSCFFSEVMGLELDRAGHDVRGRYTVPWEYYAASARPPHVVQWQEQNEKSVWTKATLWLAGMLAKASENVGFIAAILGLAILSRLLVLPFSLKAERDQIRSRALSGELEALKARLKDDPKRFSRAMKAVYRRHGLTPVRNMLALLFLPVLALSVGAVQQAATAHSGGLLWLPSLAARDPLFILPVLFGALISVYLDVALARTRRHRLLVWLVGLPLLTATGALLGAAADLYMIASAVLLLVQRAVVAGGTDSLRRLARRLRRDDGVVPLAEPDRLAGCGNKAHRLGRLRQHGIPVPDGLVLTPRFLADLATASAEQRRRRLDEVWQRLGAERIAVRSSAAAEDGTAHSFAGVFDSVLRVDRAGLEAAIAKVAASFQTARAASYAAESGAGNVLLQRMVEAEHSGVLFTRDPGAGGLAMIEMVRGTAEGLVSGSVAPQSFRFGRLSGQPVTQDAAPIDLAPLLEIGRKAEAIFGAPQDIEWTWREGRFHIVQSRDITRVLPDADERAVLERERMRVLDRAAGAGPDEAVLVQTEMSEMLPRPTPLSLSLMQELWAAGGSVDLACRSLGIDYRVEEDAPDYLVTVFGRLYVDKRQEQARAPRLGALAVRRLSRGAERIEREFREHFLPEFSREIGLLEIAEFERLSLPELFATLARVRESFVQRTYAEVDVINIAARFYLDRAKTLLADAGLDPAVCLAQVPETMQARALRLARLASDERRPEHLLQGFGHRAFLDYELSQPRYAEMPEALDALAAEAPLASRKHDTAAEAAIEAAGRAVVEAVRTARRFQALKEDAKHHALRELAVLRRLVLALDRRLDFGGLAFHLTLDELIGLREGGEVKALYDVAVQRQREGALFASVPPLPPSLTVAKLETVSLSSAMEMHRADGAIRGTRVSGSRAAEGRARVVSAADAERGAPIADLQDGDIIVSTMIHPAWVSSFGIAGGLVCVTGGWLSHTAIMAREYDLPMIVGTQGLGAIAEGSRLRLNLDGSVEVVQGKAADLPRAEAAE